MPRGACWKNAMPDDAMTATVHPCPRCEGGHSDLEFRRLRRPAGSCTFWALCPATGEPVLWLVLEDIGETRTA